MTNERKNGSFGLGYRRRLAVLAVALSLPACAPLYAPSQMTDKAIFVTEQTLIDQKPVADVDENWLAGIAAYHQRYGSAPADLTVSYLPGARDFTSYDAQKQVGLFADALRKKGVPINRADTMPVEGTPPMLLISFNKVSAAAPPDCNPMPGLTDYRTPRYVDYELGCGVQSLIARQVARPADLLGRDELSEAEGRRAANVVETYSNYNDADADAELNSFGRGDISE